MNAFVAFKKKHGDAHDIIFAGVFDSFEAAEIALEFKDWRTIGERDRCDMYYWEGHSNDAWFQIYETEMNKKVIL